MTTEIKAPNEHKPKIFSAKVFLAGSIEMGKADDWQEEIVNYLNDSECRELDGSDGQIVYNPRRDDWNSNWDHDPEFGSKFNEQVQWELDYLQTSDIVVFNFEPDTISPVTLLELGLALPTNQIKLIVCPEDYYRYGNVKLTTELVGNNCKFYHSRDENFYLDLGIALQRICIKRENG